ncbi:MAG: hypothetical protein GDA53_04860 [Rhodobacteraceae bacterium]|nr:hypothetical protein [Paracoccaceae bacterium]
MFAPAESDQGDFQGFNALNGTVIRDADRTVGPVMHLRAGSHIPLCYAPRAMATGLLRCMGLGRGVPAVMSTVGTRILARQV